MPVHAGSDQHGVFFQWGQSGKKYYYNANNEKDKREAFEKASRQARAIYASGWREKR